MNNRMKVNLKMVYPDEAARHDRSMRSCPLNIEMNCMSGGRMTSNPPVITPVDHGR